MVNICTGTLISPSFVLSAKHCMESPMVFHTGNNDTDFVAHDTNAQIPYPNDNLDLLLVHLTDPITNIQPGTLNGGAIPRPRTTCVGVGFGDHVDGVLSSGIKRSATEQITSSDSSEIVVTMISGIADRGDSGGPLLCGANNQIAAEVHNHTDGDWPDHTKENYTTVDVGWINTTQASVGFTPFVEGYPSLNFGLPSTWIPITGDFNHDGSTDYARVGATGAWVFRANRLSANGIFNDALYQDYGGLDFGTGSDWPVITGDFNHDGNMDYARVGTTGAWVFLATGLGGFNGPVFQNYNGLYFPAANWPTITGDFNGDGRTDYARVGSAGAWVFIANPASGNGGFDNPLFENYNGLNFGDPAPNWPVITGDFNHDGKTDYARVGATGAWVVIANPASGNGGFNNAVFQDYSHDGLNFGDPGTNWPTITGDFNNDGYTDYARIGATGAYLFRANPASGNGGFNDPVFQDYTHNGLNFGNPASNWQTIVGDFNGDGRTDYARIGTTGAWLFTATTGFGFTDGVSQNYDGLVFGAPSPWQVIVGDFIHSGKASYARLGGDKAYVFARF